MRRWVLVGVGFVLGVLAYVPLRAQVNNPVLFIGQAIAGGTSGRVLYQNGSVLGQMTTTGSGTVLALATSPVLVTPSLGVATATSLNGNTFTTGTYTLTGSSGKTLTFNNSLTLAGTDSTTMTFPSTSATIARTDAANTFTGASTGTSWTLTTLNLTTSGTLSNNTINSTSTDGFVIQNTTAATSSQNQWSPRLHFIGEGWKTNSTAGTQQVEWLVELTPKNGAANTTGTLRLTPIINGTTASNSFGFCAATTGNPTANGAAYGLLLDGGGGNGCDGQVAGWAGLGPVNSSNTFGFWNNGSVRLNSNINGLTLASGSSIFWSATASSSFAGGTTGDSGICRGGIGQLNINDGSTTCTNARDLLQRHPLGGGTAPTVAGTSMNSCGTTAPSIAGSDAAGKVTVGATSGTSCTVTFGTAWTNAPSCHAEDETGTPAALGTVTTTTTVVISGVFGAADTIKYMCMGY